MRIILDCDLMKYPNSGLYYYCQSLGVKMNELFAQRNETAMKMYVPKSARDAFGNRDHCIVEKKWHRLLAPFLWNCDVWHAPFQSGRILPDKQRYRNIKTVLTVHDLNPLHEGKSPEEQKRSVAHTQNLIDQSDAIVCISEFTRNDVLRNCEVGRKPVYVIYNGTSVLEQPLLHTESYQPRRPFLFGIGYVNQKKNYHVLLSLLKSNENIELLIAGRLDEPDYIHDMKQMAIRNGVEDRLRLLGPVTDSEKAWYMSNCHAFMHPSKAEGFGLPVVEAMSFGKPVFISNLTSLPEIGGDAAFYFSSFEEGHIQHTFYEGMRRYSSENLSAVLKMRSREFSWEKSAAEYIKVYQSLF